MTRVVDLTLPLASGDRGVKIEPARRLEKDGWNATTLSLYSHCGTHMDAPIHFGIGTQMIDSFAAEDFIGPAWVADVRPVEPRVLIKPEHLGDITDQFEPGDSLLICTGWSDYYGQEKYRNELPRVSLELVLWCADKKVKMLGVEQPSVADVNDIDELTAIHQILFENEIIVVEGLANLVSLSKPKVTFIALPLKIAGGDGAPARAVAIEDDD